jgi:hypothetical protein
MNNGFQPHLNVIDEIFAEEIAAVGGRVHDRVASDTRLFLRSVVAPDFEVRERDRMHSGVALFACGDAVRVLPYHFRLVCKNGAIRSHATQSQQIALAPAGATPLEVSQVEQEIRCAIVSSASPEAREDTEHELSLSLARDADFLLTMLPVLARQKDIDADRFLAPILDGWRRGRDRSVFGLMNAVTAVAREAPDQEDRRRLEELGGGLPAILPRNPTPLPTRVDRVVRRELQPA